MGDEKGSACGPRGWRGSRGPTEGLRKQRVLQEGKLEPERRRTGSERKLMRGSENAEATDALEASGGSARNGRWCAPRDSIASQGRGQTRGATQPKCGRAPPEPPELRQKLGRAAQTQATQEAAGGPRRLTPCQQQPAPSKSGTRLRCLMRICTDYNSRY